MKIRFSLVLSAMLLYTISADAFDCGQMSAMEMRTEDGTRVILRIPSEMMLKSPKWRLGDGEPPLSITKATLTAKAWAKNKFNQFDDVIVTDLTIRGLGCWAKSGYSYYEISFAPVYQGNMLFGSGNIVAVLMDGTIVAPSIDK